MTFALGVAIFFAGLLFSIAWHEFGHLAAAKRFDVKATQYMVGFGPTLWSRRRGETEYGVKAIPLGGYVRIVGMLPPAPDGRVTATTTAPWRQMVDDARRQAMEEVEPGDDGRLFYQQAPWKRTIVMLAGPFQNLLLAVVLFLIVLMGFGVLTPSTTVASVSDCVLPADTTETACPAGAPEAPGKAAGMQAGDRVVAFQGEPVKEWEDLQDKIRASAGQVTLTVERDGRLLDLTPTLVQDERPALDGSDRTERVGFLGVSPLEEVEQQSLGEALATMRGIVDQSVDALLDLPSRIPDLWGATFQGEERSADSPVGVVGASRLGGEVLTLDEPASQRVAAMVLFVGGFNLILFLFNMLPLLPLDGGHVAGALWEALRRWFARLRGRPDPGPFDVAKLMPAAYLVAVAFIGFSLLLVIADLVNPVTLN